MKMRNIPGQLFSLFVCVLLFSACGCSMGPSNAADAKAFDRILKEEKIRAGYVSYPPGSIVSPSGTEVTGIFPDMLREIGKITKLQIEFVEEAGWATLIEGLNTGRYDIIGGFWSNPIRGKLAMTSNPAYFSALGVWVRADETRISSENNWASLNTSDIRIAAIDGSTPLSIVQSDFPQATLKTYPNLTNESQLFLDLTSGRVDVFLAEPAQGLLFLKSNPGSITNLAADQPLKIFANVFLMPQGEAQLKNMIDVAMADLQYSGKIDQLLDKYEPVEGAFYRVITPHAVIER